MPEETRLLEIESLETAIEVRDPKEFLRLSEELHYADLASIFEALDDEERSFFTQYITLDQFPEILQSCPTP